MINTHRAPTFSKCARSCSWHIMARVVGRRQTKPSPCRLDAGRSAFLHALMLLPCRDLDQWARRWLTACVQVYIFRLLIPLLLFRPSPEAQTRGAAGCLWSILA